MARHFSHWLRAYVDHAQVSESPLIYHVWTAVSTIAGALRRNVWIDEIRFKYYPNFYIVLVGPAALTKTTALNSGKRMLSQVKGVWFGPASATWQSMIKNMSLASQEIKIDTPAGVQALTTCPLHFSVGELGTFFKIEDSVMMEVLIDLWDGHEGSWTHSTLTMGDNSVENPIINLIGGTTPSWLKEHFPENMIGGGLASRMLFVFADVKHRLIAFPSREIRQDHYYKVEERLLDDLQQIAKLTGCYQLTNEAMDWGQPWYEHHHTHRPEHLASDRYSAYLGRKFALLMKLSMIVAAGKRDEMVIEREDLEESLAMLEMIEPHMQKVFESIGRVDEARRGDELIAYVKAYNVLTSAELFTFVQNVMSSKDFSTTLQSAVKSGKLRLVKKGGLLAVAMPLTLKEVVGR